MGRIVSNSTTVIRHARQTMGFPLKLKRRRAALSRHGYAVARGRLHPELERLLAGSLTDPDNARLAKRLCKHRAHLVTFLDREGVDARSVATHLCRVERGYRNGT